MSLDHEEMMRCAPGATLRKGKGNSSMVSNINLKSHFLKYCIQLEHTAKDRNIKHFSKVCHLTDKVFWSTV